MVAAPVPAPGELVLHYDESPVKKDPKKRSNEPSEFDSKRSKLFKDKNPKLTDYFKATEKNQDNNPVSTKTPSKVTSNPIILDDRDENISQSFSVSSETLSESPKRITDIHIPIPIDLSSQDLNPTPERPVTKPHENGHIVQLSPEKENTNTIANKNQNNEEKNTTTSTETKITETSTIIETTSKKSIFSDKPTSVTKNEDKANESSDDSSSSGRIYNPLQKRNPKSILSLRTNEQQSNPKPNPKIDHKIHLLEAKLSSLSQAIHNTERSKPKKTFSLSSQIQ